MQYDFAASHREGKAVYYFDRPGRHTLRARYVPAKSTRRPGHYPSKEEVTKSAEGVVIHSNEAAFVVEEYEGADKAAVEWLKARRLPHFMYDLEQWAQDTDDDARYVIDQFPQSRFAPWAKLALARCYRYGLQHRKGRKITTDPPDLDKAAELALEAGEAADPYLQKAAKELLQGINLKRRQQGLPEIEYARSRSGAWWALACVLLVCACGGWLFYRRRALRGRPKRATAGTDDWQVPGAGCPS